MSSSITNDTIKTMASEEVKASTTFLGVKIDTVNGPTDPRIQRALDYGFHLLDILKFIDVVDFKLNKTMFDYFWQIVVENQCSMITTLILEWFGYEGDARVQRQNFKRMLKNSNICYRELTQKDEELKAYPRALEELHLLPHEGARSCAKFLVMEPDDFKRALMQLKTKKSNEIRDYYMDMEKLLKLYVEYTLYFNHRESQRKITGLEQMMADMRLTMTRMEEEGKTDRKHLRCQLNDIQDQNEELLDHNKDLQKDVKKVHRKLGIAVEDRAPLPEDTRKQERFVLLKTNNSDYWSYYTIRAQDSYVVRKLKEKKEVLPKMKVLLDLKCNPNSKTLYNRIKEQLKADDVHFKGNSIDLSYSLITEKKLIEEMMVINDSKRDV